MARALPSPLTGVELIIIGDEILSGRRQDGHMAHVIATLAPMGVEVERVVVVGDHRQRLTDCLSESRQRGKTVFCFGGIGATPDDHTRQAAAAAWGVAVVRHPEAVAILEERFGPQAYPHRILMAELPACAGLIPNPYNRIPGFFLEDHWFFPGFPEMAWPMLEWVLASHYRVSGEAAHVRCLHLPHGKEGEVVAILEKLEQSFPQIKTFSLPRLGVDATLELGIKGGEAASVEAAFAQLWAWLNGAGLLGVES